MAGVIALMGSGETAPGMTKVHRRLLARHEDVRAVNLDSPYGFQENVPQVTEKLVEYFSTSLTTRLRTLALPSYEAASDLERALVKREVRQATYVFAGPGSPSYALNQWRPLGLADDLRAVLDDDGTLCFSSAAVLTLGAHTAPIYEVYKVGLPARWLEGLNLLGDLGLDCAAIPHYDNAEGRNYDTRYCYLGERRLRELEAQLPTGSAILGVDEHTALLLDVDADTVSVVGRSRGHWRVHGETLDLENGSVTPLATLREMAGSVRRDRASTPPLAPSAEIDELLARVDQSGYDPAPLVEGILALRDAAKAEGNYALADRLRAALTDAGIAVHDQVGSTTWEIVIPRD